MRRFPPRDLPPRGRPPKRELPRRETPRAEGPFDRLLRSRPQRDPAPFIIGGTIGFLAVVIILVFALSGLFGGNGDGASDSGQVGPGINPRRSRMPALPPGLAASSDYWLLEAEEDVPATIGLPLREKLEDPTGLGFYTFQSNRWQRVADVRLAQEGKVGEADFSPVPKNLAVLRVVGQAYQVVGSLPSQGSLHPDARVNIVSPRDFMVAEGGEVQGESTKLEVGEDVLLMPTIMGGEGDRAEIVNDILDDEGLRGQHIERIVTLVNDGGYDGIDLEYSAVDPALAPAFTEFVKTLAEQLHDGGRRLSLTLPPPLAKGQRQAYDWEALGNAADMIKVLPVADPVDYRETMPEALTTLTSQADPKKLLLVVSPFSVERTDAGPKTIGYLQAMVLASEVKIREPEDLSQIRPASRVVLVAANLAQGEGASGLRWSDEAAAVTFSFGGAESRTIFIENGFSVGFKLEMVQAFGLGGLAVSDASAQADVANVWTAVNGFLGAGTPSLVRPNDDSLLPRWDAQGGKLGGGTGSSTTWEAPQEPGSYQLALLISDGDRRFGRRLTLETKSAPQPAPTPLVTFGPEETPTPTPAPVPTPTPTPASTLPLQVGKRVDGDGDGGFSDSEGASPGATVTYRIVIDNDSKVPVTITSLVDDKYPGVVCKDEQGNSVIGQALGPDDGDGGDVGAVDELGPDAVTCKFGAQAPNDSNQFPVKDAVTVTVQDGAGNKGSDRDGATITSG